jgi:alkanesulfonate monooxygenase SsuD/methylene tetrahydromethanopterin reductase-like flavin-dependent oxidoreductase (luciferase family)
MKVGVYFDLRNPPAWRQDWTRLYGFTLEMCQEAEHLGLDSVWTSEHHMFEDGYLTQPLTFMAAIAAVTKRVRLGSAVLLAPLRPAIQIAEEATIVDIISGGRVDIGLGAGYRHPEFELFGADIAKRYTTTDRRVVELREIFADDRHVPSPVNGQIPIYLGYQGPKGARRAGRLGAGLLSANGELWEPYREGLAEGGHDPSIARMKGSFPAWVTDDPEADWPRVKEHLRYQLDTYRRYMVEGTDMPIPRPVDPERTRLERSLGRVLGSFVHGTPEQVAAAVRAHAGDAPVEEFFIFASIAGMPEQMVADHIRLVATKLKPLLDDEVNA